MHSHAHLLARIYLLLGSFNLSIQIIKNYFLDLLNYLFLAEQNSSCLIFVYTQGLVGFAFKNPSLPPTFLKFGSEIIREAINKSSMIELSLVSIPGSQIL